MNPITIYLLQAFIDFKKIALFFVGGIMRYSGSADQVVLMATVLGIKWLILLYLYRNKTFLQACRYRRGQKSRRLSVHANYDQRGLPLKWQGQRIPLGRGICSRRPFGG